MFSNDILLTFHPAHSSEDIIGSKKIPISKSCKKKNIPYSNMDKYLKNNDIDENIDIKEKK